MYFLNYLLELGLIDSMFLNEVTQSKDDQGWDLVRLG